MKALTNIAILVLALAGLACQTSILGVPVSIASATPPAPLPTGTDVPASAQPKITPAGAMVCFQNDIVDGRLRVRECAGLECQEAGIVAAGDLLAFTGERQVVDGATWLRIERPLQGWINARYVCEE